MKRAKRHPPLAPKPRNPVARSALLGKGGPHGKSTRAARRRATMQMRKIERDPDAQS